MPAAARQAIACAEKPAMTPSPPNASVSARKIGTPTGTVIDSAWITEAVSTPRRAVAVSNANPAADKSASNPPSTAVS
jgi:hypothetical protein